MLKGHDGGTELIFPMIISRHLLQVVLVNGGTASTSELLAGALHDSAGVQLVGENTFGKGVTQRVVPLSDGSVLLVSTASYMTPRHMPVHKVSLTTEVSGHFRLECLWSKTHVRNAWYHG